ncbi:hypothetical protein [Spongiactinospora sp. 9N601]|uniref:hypothetical protein n=1 Tax=Spongiactinospora sp. 9N601 TaxID=3375149 RepID=UPI00379F5EB7
MALSDWTIVGSIALHWINGHLIVLTARPYNSLEEAIKAYEKRESERRNRDLAELGHLVDAAFERMRGSRHPPDTEARPPPGGPPR